MTEKKLSRIERLEQELAEAKAKAAEREAKEMEAAEMKLERMAARLVSMDEKIQHLVQRKGELSVQYAEAFDEFSEKYGRPDDTDIADVADAIARNEG